MNRLGAAAAVVETAGVQVKIVQNGSGIFFNCRIDLRSRAVKARWVAPETPADFVELAQDRRIYGCRGIVVEVNGTFWIKGSFRIPYPFSVSAITGHESGVHGEEAAPFGASRFFQL